MLSMVELSRKLRLPLLIALTGPLSAAAGVGRETPLLANRPCWQFQVWM
jgi:hypothetical protein